MSKKLTGKEFYHKLKRIFDQYKCDVMIDYFPKLIRLTAIKLFEMGIIARDKVDLVIKDHMSFFNDDYFTTEHHLATVIFLIADILHSGDDVFGKVYNRQYNDYISRTSIWKEKSNLVKERDKYTCQNCGISFDDFTMPKLDCDHTNYNNVYGELLDDLITLCRICHNTKHSVV